MYRTRGARGGSKLNRTLHESPATASLHSAIPKRKNVPCFSYFRGGRFFLKWKGHFSFWGSAFQVFRQCGGASIRTRFCENYFLGIWIFAKPRLISDFASGGEVWGGMRAGFRFGFFGGDSIKFKLNYFLP